MTAVLANLARMYTNTPGTGSMRLTVAVPPFISFDDAGVNDGDQVYYAINDFVGRNVEIGVGTYTQSGKVLSRDTIYRSSRSGNAKISLSGQAEVAVSPPKEFFTAFVPAVGTIRLPSPAASVSILTSDVEVGINTIAIAVSALLPSAAAWAAVNINGLDLTILDYTGHGDTHNITPVVAGSDIFLGGLTPLVTNSYGLIRLRPFIDSNAGQNGWYLRQ